MALTAERIYHRVRTGNIVAVFQAIISTSTGRLIGAEALSRFPNSTRNPEQWFKDAAEVGLGSELELAAIRGSLQAASCLPADIYLSVNVSPTTLVHPGLRGALTSGRVALSRLVLEVTEHATIEDYDDVVGALADLRAHGVRVAVDDAGAGYASFRHILRLAPEFIKLDRSLIAGLDSDPALRALASAVVSFGAEMNSSIIAEGIETLAELRCAQTLGISAAQGYLFGRPTNTWDTWAEWHRRGPVISVHAADPRRVS